MICGIAEWMPICLAEWTDTYTAGSSYLYVCAFVTLGELPAFATFCMLTLEFLLSGSAVSWQGECVFSLARLEKPTIIQYLFILICIHTCRSWGDKVVEWLRVELNVNKNVLLLLEHCVSGVGWDHKSCHGWNKRIKCEWFSVIIFCTYLFH